MFNQGDLTAFANQFGMYIDISVCDECLKPEGNSEHGFDCDEYKAIYGWVESRVREQIATGIEAISDYQVLETTNRKGFESQMEVTDAVKKLAIAIARRK